MFVFRTNNYLSKSNMSNSKYYTVVDVVPSGFKPYDGTWEDTANRKWVSLADRSLKGMVEVAIDCIRDQNTPKNILVLFFQRFVGGVPLNIIRGYLDEILQEARAQRWNKVSFSTCWFTPTHQKVWQQVADFNALVHGGNELMGRARVNIHRAVMTRVSEDSYQLRSRWSMWAEPQMGLALGFHLSHEGMVKVVDMVHEVLDTSFKMKRKRSSSESEAVFPPPLHKTPGWNKNRFMLRLLEDKGLIRIERKAGERRERRSLMSNQQMTGYQDWHVYKTHGELPRFQQREGILEAMVYMWNRADKVPVWVDDEEECAADEVVATNDVLVESEVVVEKEVVVEEAIEAFEGLEVEKVKGTEVVQDDGEESDGDDPYDPEGWTANKDIVIEINNDMFIDGNGEDEVFVEDSVVEQQSIEKDVEEKGVATGGVQDIVSGEEKEDTKYNEDDNNVSWLLNRLKHTERKFKVEKEKAKAYKADLAKEKVALVREKASVKFWREQVAVKEERIEELEKENNRLEETKKFERNAYKARTAFPGRKERRNCY